jgi:hypothetical protein
MATSASFTRDAEAARYDIALVDSTMLRTWATFGKRLELN